MNKKPYSSELLLTLKYMNDVLSKEFNLNEFLTEHLIVSILDNKKSHANQILDNCLMTSNIIELKKIYSDFLYGKVDKTISNIQIPTKFNDELNKILLDAENECILLGSNEVGTEHVILSMLKSENNHTKIQDVFKNVGIDYNFFLNKCLEIVKNGNEQKKSKKMNLLNQFTMPLKSDMNKKLISSKNEYIEKYTINLNKLSKEGKIDELVGREKEIKKIIKILARRKKNNVILVGKGGCGKSHIVYGLSNLIEKDEVPSILQGKEIVMLDIMSLVSGTHFRGMFEERVKGLFDELKNNKNYILFIDDIQTVLKSSSKEKDTDISSMISEILAGGDVRVIGTTNFKDYRNSVENNSSISRKLQRIVIEPATIEETIEILNRNKHYYEDYHNVIYPNNVIEKCVELSDRYITDRSLPDSALDVIDLTGAYTCLDEIETDRIKELKKELKNINNEKTKSLENGDFEIAEDLSEKENLLMNEINKLSKKDKKEKKSITIDDIALSISDMTNIPIHKLTSNEKEKISNIENILKKEVIGQDEAVEKICRIIKRNKVGLGDKNKTLGNCLLLGPSGVGKTLIAKKLAEEIFGSERDLVRIDMSEYSEKNSVAKLTGAAPGYIGFENGGQLTEAIKHKQHCVLLLDEIEKADQEVYNLFLQLFDEGRLTDNSGQIINFKNVIVLMTSNIGAKQASELGKGLGFVNDEESNKKSIVDKQLKKTFTPEFINRIDQIVHFNSLNDTNLKDIVILELNKFIKRLNEINYNLIYDENTIEFVYSLAIKDKEYGARPIIRIIQDNIEDKITDLLLSNDYIKDYTFKSTVINGKLTIN